MRSNPQKWQDMQQGLHDQQGVTVVSMITLRDLEGVARLGVNVINNIDTHLTLLGIGHIPAELPMDGKHDVILYEVDSPAGRIVESIKTGQVGLEVARMLEHVNATSNVSVRQIKEYAGSLVKVAFDIAETTGLDIHSELADATTSNNNRNGYH